MGYLFQFLIETIFHIIQFILYWCMNAQNNDAIPENSYYYV
jgi:hypothetical protein